MQSRLRKLYKNIFTRIMCAVVILAGGIAACSFCSKAADEPTYTLKFEVIGSDETEKTAKVTGCEGIVSGDLIIPDTVEIEGHNYKVTSIGDDAFLECSGFTKLILGKNVNSIGTFAFLGCSNLSGELIIPDSVTSISPAAFLECSGFTKLILGKNVNSIGNCAFQGCSNLSGELVIPDGVESIGKFLFLGCSNLSGELVIPDSVESIGNGAFTDCSGFTKLILGKNVNSIGSSAFQGCSNLSGELVIPDSVESIGNYAFQRCSGFTKLTLGKKVNIIGEKAFGDCSNLEGDVIIPDSVTSIGENAFSECKKITSISLPCKFKTSSLNIGHDYVFRHDFENDGVIDEDKQTCATCGKKNICYKGIDICITNPTYNGSELAPTVLIKDGDKTLARGTDYELVYETKTDVGKYEITIKGINDYAGTINTSWYITSYKLNAEIISETKTVEITRVSGDASGELVIPDTVEIGGKIYKVTSIGESAFSGCSNLSGELVIPDSVESIGDYAFFCSGFTKLKLGKNVNSIGESAFDSCFSLSGELVIPDSVESIGNYAFLGCFGFTKLILGKNVNSIGDYAFKGCSKLSGELVIPDSIESIGDYAFPYCFLFTKLKLGKNVNSIGDYAFKGCSRLSGELVIPDSVESIGDYAFEYCINLSGELIIPDSVTSIGENAFSECEKITKISLPCKIDTSSLKIGHDYVIRHDFEKDGVYDTDKQTCATCSKKNICYKDIKVNITNPTYDGSELAPTVEIKDGEKTLEEGTDYELTYDKQTNAGEYEMTINGINAYAGTIKKTWRIVKAIPTFEVPTNLKGKCGYALSTITFVDSHMAWEDSTCVMIGDEESSEPITRNFKAIYTPDDTDNYEIVTFDVNVEISHVNASPVKENNVEPTYEKDGSYDEVVYCEKCKTELSRDKKTVDKLVKVDISNEDIKVNITNPTYDGSELAPTVEIKDGEKTLEAGNDYELAYDKQTNAGEYEMTINGINAYAGTIKTTWKINKATLSDDMLAKIKNEVPTNLKGKCGYALSTITFEDSHMTWEDSTCVMTGEEKNSEPITRTFKAIYTPDDTDNYEIVTFDVNVEISHVNASPVKENNEDPTYEKDGSYDEVVYCEKCKTELNRENKTVDKLVDINNENIKVNITNPTYDGSELAPTVEIKDGEKTLEAGNDYELAYDKQTNAGEYEMTIKGINAYAGTIKTTWKINKATLSDDMLTKIKNEVLANLKGKCGYALSTITFEDSHMAWEDSTCVMIGDEESSEPITRTFKAIYTPDNYETATFDVNVEISHVKASPVKENNVAPTYEKDGSYDEVVYCEKCKTELSRDKKTVDKLVKPAPDDPDDPDDPDSPDVPVGLENGDVINLAKQKCMIMVSDVKKHEASYYKSTNKKAKTVSVPATVKIDGITFKVTAISDNAFKNNTKATKIVIPSNVKKLGKNLFKNLKKLKTIQIKSTKLTKKTIDKKTFAGLNKKATIKVPKKKLKAYKKLFKTMGLNKKIKVK